jgi:alpha,alpha-trehalase
MMKGMNMMVKEYIQRSWDNTVRTTSGGEETLISLPHPYTVPCADGAFQELYYWDTYFTNRGLLLSGREELVLSNLKNFAYLINTYGFIPNGNRTYYLNRSQPPFFGMMLADYYRATGDKAFLREGYQALCKEYTFWMTRRLSPNGLNCYSADARDDEYGPYVGLYAGRTGIFLEGDVKTCGTHVMAEAESGWDFNPRFHSRCHDYNPVDLNSLLWFDETFLGECERTLGIGDGESWDRKAYDRKEKMISLMRDGDGVFYDYCYADDVRGDVVSCAAFYPAAVGMIEDDRGMDILLRELELAHGLQATGHVEGNFQWGEKNGWAALQLMAYEALAHVGRAEDAERIARKYVSMVESTFEETGRLWEKYNIVTGDHRALSEYGTPEMLGWSAGVYMALSDVL